MITDTNNSLVIIFSLCAHVQAAMCVCVCVCVCVCLCAPKCTSVHLYMFVRTQELVFANVFSIKCARMCVRLCVLTWGGMVLAHSLTGVRRAIFLRLKSRLPEKRHSPHPLRNQNHTPHSHPADTINTKPFPITQILLHSLKYTHIQEHTHTNTHTNTHIYMHVCVFEWVQ